MKGGKKRLKIIIWFAIFGLFCITPHFKLCKNHFSPICHLFQIQSVFGRDLCCCLLSTGGFGGLQLGSDIEEVVRYRDGYCLLSGEPININGLTPAKTSLRNQNFLRYQIL